MIQPLGWPSSETVDETPPEVDDLRKLLDLGNPLNQETSREDVSQTIRTFTKYGWTQHQIDTGTANVLNNWEEDCWCDGSCGNPECCGGPYQTVKDCPLCLYRYAATHLHRHVATNTTRTQ
jgi:hypothetical protein